MGCIKLHPLFLVAMPLLLLHQAQASSIFWSELADDPNWLLLQTEKAAGVPKSEVYIPVSTHQFSCVACVALADAQDLFGGDLEVAVR